MRNTKTLYMVQLAMLTAILLILNFTPLGFLRIGPVEISFMTIPVVVGAIMMGPLAGGILGLVFGLCSFALAPSHPIFGVAFVQNPILVAGICIIPRVLIGVICGLFARALEKTKHKLAVYGAAAFLGSLINTVLFLGGVVLLLGNILAPAMTEGGLLTDKTFGMFWLVVGLTNGIPEAIASTALTLAVVPALKKITKKS